MSELGELLALFILCVVFNIISSFGFECSESLGCVLIG